MIWSGRGIGVNRASCWGSWLARSMCPKFVGATQLTTLRVRWRGSKWMRCRSVQVGTRKWRGPCIVIFVGLGDATTVKSLGKFAADDACYRYTYPENAGEFGDEMAFVVPAEISQLGKFTPESGSTVVASLRRIFAHLVPSGAP